MAGGGAANNAGAFSHSRLMCSRAAPDRLDAINNHIDVHGYQHPHVTRCECWSAEIHKDQVSVQHRPIESGRYFHVLLDSLRANGFQTEKAMFIDAMLGAAALVWTPTPPAGAYP